MHQVEVLLDGESVRGRVMIDRTGTTTLTQQSEISFDHWEKRVDGQKISSDLVFQQTENAEEEEEDTGCGMASAPNDWTSGSITLRVYAGQLQRLQADAHAVNHAPQIGNPLHNPPPNLLHIPYRLPPPPPLPPTPSTSTFPTPPRPPHPRQGSLSFGEADGQGRPHVDRRCR